MDGELVHLRLFDVGAEVDLARVTALRGRPSQPAPLVTRSAAPPYAGFPSPREVRFPAADGPAGSTLEIRVHATGVVAVRLRTPFSVAALDDLIPLAQSLRLGGLVADDGLTREYTAVLEELRPALIRPYTVTVDAESYLVYCVTSGAPSLDDAANPVRDSLAALVAGEPTNVLVEDVVASALKHTVRYYRHDAVIVGWDNAVILGHPDSYEDVLDIIELANLELLEFRTYDAYLDQRLEQSFAALHRLWAPGGLFRSARSALQDISELRVEVARLTDNLHDTGKLFGDWYMAKVHQRLHDRFHLSSWERAVATKMETLESMFHLAEEEANHRRSLTLEVLVVLIFIFDVLLLLVRP